MAAVDSKRHLSSILGNVYPILVTQGQENSFPLSTMCTGYYQTLLSAHGRKGHPDRVKWRTEDINWKYKHDDCNEDQARIALGDE